MQPKINPELPSATPTQPPAANAVPFDWKQHGTAPLLETVLPPTATPDRYAWTQVGKPSTIPGDPAETARSDAASIDTSHVNQQLGDASPAPSMHVDRAPRRIGQKLLATTLGVGLLAGAALWARGGGGDTPSAATADRPVATASPAPQAAPSTAPPNTETSLPTTIAQGAEVKSLPTSPSTTATTAPKPAVAAEKAASPSSTITAPAEAKTAEKRVLADEEVQKIIANTKYEGLAGHSFDVAADFTTDAARYVVINLDGCESAVPLKELQNDINLAEADAAKGSSFSTKVQLGPGVSKLVTFKASPSKLTRDGTDTRYIIYANSELKILTGPSYKDFKDSSTISMPGKHMNVTLIKNHSAKDKVDGMPANSFYAGAEARQTTTWFDLDVASEHEIDQERPDMSYVTSSTNLLQQKADLVNIGREVYINSLAYAQESARAGVPYAQYKEQALRIPLRAYAAQASVFYIAVSEAQYNSL
ncbi:MAG TPA: hypothetical protein VM124_00705 [Candidatus Limnocylindrales bacterium]|nr:hypothetical protein [Candidatus Limnocylindrales bacterium]